LQTAKGLVLRLLAGSSLTRRERKQLLRTVTDLFRLVPFSMFLIIPFMEFALPFALRVFPNMLPSTFQDSLKAEETMKRELQSRISMTRFFQETMEELAKEQKRKAASKKKELLEAGEDDKTIHLQEDSAASMLEFLEKARSGEAIPPDIIIRYANYFHDDFTLDNMVRLTIPRWRPLRRPYRCIAHIQ
jgi:LETM1 and EF-hand domain-containing protein 1